MRTGSPVIGLLVAVAAASCRERATVVARADPTPPASGSASIAAPAPPASIHATVLTNRVEIPRKGHPPVILELPAVTGLADPAVQRDVAALLTPEVLLGESLADVRAEAASVTSAADLAGGLQSATYTVEYDAHGILGIKECSESMGAYPSTTCVRVLVDLERGRAIGAAVAFLPAAVPGLVARLDARVKAEATSSAAAKDPDFGDLAKHAGYEPQELDTFRVADDGVTFFHDYGFPHVALALQPPGEFFFPWRELAADVDPHGPLSRVRAAP